MTGPIELSIVVVNWNSAEHLRACLTSIFSRQREFNLEVLVVDNGSYDGCGELVRQEFPQVRFLQSPRNLGFAAANNLAFAFSLGRNLLFLNPDTELVGDSLRLMLDVLADTADAGIVGPRLVNPDLSPQWNCMRCVPTILNQLLDTSFSRAIFPRWWGLEAVARELQHPVAVEVVPGTCLMVRREVFAQAGLFNLTYFMYAEDVDLCCQAHKLGWKTYYVHGAVVIHRGACSSQLQEDHAFSAILMRESVGKFLSASRGRLYAALYRAATSLVAICRLLVCGGLSLTARRDRRGLWRIAAKKWTRVLRWSLGWEEWASSLGRPRPQAVPAAEIRPALSSGQSVRA